MDCLWNILRTFRGLQSSEVTLSLWQQVEINFLHFNVQNNDKNYIIEIWERLKHMDVDSLFSVLVIKKSLFIAKSITCYN